MVWGHADQKVLSFFLTFFFLSLFLSFSFVEGVEEGGKLSWQASSITPCDSQGSNELCED